jgi:hypothetical protein
LLNASNEMEERLNTENCKGCNRERLWLIVQYPLCCAVLYSTLAPLYLPRTTSHKHRNQFVTQFCNTALQERWFTYKITETVGGGQTGSWNAPHLTQPKEYALSCSQQNANGPYPEPDEFNPQLHSPKVFRFKIHFNIIIWYKPRSPKWSLPFKFANWSLARASRPAHFILFDLITLIG